MGKIIYSAFFIFPQKQLNFIEIFSDSIFNYFIIIFFEKLKWY